MNKSETVSVRRWHTHNGHSSVPRKPVIAASNASATPTLPLSGTSKISSLTSQTLSTSGPSTVSSLTPQTFSTSGTFNGTSLTTFHSTFSGELATHLFYQDYQGQLRRIEKDGSQWSGGPSIAAVVSSNAKNGTPLGCANYTDVATNAQKVRLSALSRLRVSNDNPVQANLFYVDPNNMLQEVISTDNFRTWETGTLGDSAVKVSEPAFALTAWYMAEYGLRLYYGGADGLVHEMVYISDEGSGLSSFNFKTPMAMVESLTLYMMTSLESHNSTCSIHRMVSGFGTSISPLRQAVTWALGSYLQSLSVYFF